MEEMVGTGVVEEMVGKCVVEEMVGKGVVEEMRCKPLLSSIPLDRDHGRQPARVVNEKRFGSHGTLVAVSAPFMMPLRDSDIPMNVLYVL